MAKNWIEELKLDYDEIAQFIDISTSAPATIAVRVAQAQLAKALWGLHDKLYLEVTQQPNIAFIVSAVSFWLKEELKEAGVEKLQRKDVT